MSPFEPIASRYETIARIGRGGMAEVLLAASRSGGVVKLAVLKCLWPELEEDADFVEMFLDEARLATRMSHPNVVQTHELVRHDGRLALAMEYLDGQPLTRVLSRLGSVQALSLRTRLRIMTCVLAGLEHVHTLADFDGVGLNVVHRDVSPHNVVITYDGHIKLLDFGVAKTLAGRHQTRPGAIKGKLSYLSPEAVRGEPVDRRADIFSVGVMLWELLAGKRLWDRASDSGLAARMARGEPPPPLPAELEVPPALRTVCARALALDPAARPQTAAAFGTELERIGVDASLAHARRLGQLVGEMFEDERAQRRALIEFHLGPSKAVEHTPGFDYATFEVSPRPPAPIAAAAVEPAVEPTPAPSASWPSFPPTPPARRSVGLGRAVLMVATVALVALVSGAYLGRAKISRPLFSLSSTPSSAPEAAPTPTRAAAPAPPAAAAALVPPTQSPQALSDREDQSARRRRQGHRAGDARARRAADLDLLSDDVLDLDGEPLAPPPSSRASRD